MSFAETAVKLASMDMVGTCCTTSDVNVDDDRAGATVRTYMPLLVKTRTIGSD